VENDELEKLKRNHVHRKWCMIDYFLRGTIPGSERERESTQADLVYNYCALVVKIIPGMIACDKSATK
jgi:hypothetical protein